MKNILSLGAAAGIALLMIAGCGDDEPTTPTEVNTYFATKQGDTFTYARYDRDMNNQRVAGTKTMHKWVVIQTGLQYEGKTGVTKMLQLNYDSSGTTQTGAPDTVYLRSAIDGEIFMNVISATLSRIPIAAAFADSIPFAWFKVSDTKIANTSTWFSLGASSGIIKDVQYPFPGLGTVPLRVIITANAYHKGKVATSVGSTAYPNAFHTDHSVKMNATALGQPIIQDSLHLSYDVDVNNGILRQVMESDSVTATIPGSPAATEAVAGFEMELVAVVRAK
jgi:hypothetical protein